MGLIGINNHCTHNLCQHRRLIMSDGSFLTNILWIVGYSWVYLNNYSNCASGLHLQFFRCSSFNRMTFDPSSKSVTRCSSTYLRYCAPLRQDGRGRCGCNCLMLRVGGGSLAVVAAMTHSCGGQGGNRHESVCCWMWQRGLILSGILMVVCGMFGSWLQSRDQI